MKPFYDYTALTEDQLYEKLRKAREYLSMQQSLGHTDTAYSIQVAIDALENERMRRISDTPALSPSNKKAKKNQDDLLKKQLEPITFGKLDNE